MRGFALVLVLALPALSGCLTFLDDDKEGGAVEPADVGYDPGTIRVTQVVKHEATVPSLDAELATIAYEPKSSSLTPDGTPPRWGTVIFVHGWGGLKETYEGAGGATGTPAPSSEEAKYTTNYLQAFADNGLVAVAYDARGFGRSTGQATIAGPAEMADLEAIRAWAEATFPSNGLFGVVGVSYGGGHAFQSWADNPRITTAVPMYGWVDLYDGLLPGNVPKAEWAVALGAGAGATKGQVSPLLAEWYQKAITRSGLEGVEAEMDARSVAGRMGTVAKPLFACQGMQETLFPQVDQAWEQAGGFTRALVFTGGHSAMDPECWKRALDWFRYFLGGHDTGVADWPALTTVDAGGGRALDYGAFPRPVPTTYYLDAPNLERNYPSNSTFVIEQRLLNNPLQEPAYFWDQLGMPNNEVPQQFREDPGAVTFDTAPITGSEVVLGAPTLRLALADPAAATPFQVTGQLLHVDANGRSTILTRGAYAALGPEDIGNGTITLRFHWVKADLAPGDRLVLKLGANDSSWFMPLMANYAVGFRGTSELDVPYFQG